MPIAKVAVVSPLAVRLRGDLTNTAATLKSSTIAALSVNDDVWVEHDEAEGKLVVAYKLVTA